MSKFLRRFLFLSLLLIFTADSFGQWTHRYPKLANVSHHVYLEGYNLPTLNQGATDPAVSPDGKTVAIAARGWIWLMDTTTREAKRLSKSGAVDSRPAWSPDGRQIVFVRDDTKDTSIILIDAASGTQNICGENKRSDRRMDCRQNLRRRDPTADVGQLSVRAHRANLVWSRR